jgi:hypothetical protein
MRLPARVELELEDAYDADANEKSPVLVELSEPGAVVLALSATWRAT